MDKKLVNFKKRAEEVLEGWENEEYDNPADAGVDVNDLLKDKMIKSFPEYKEKLEKLEDEIKKICISHIKKWGTRLTWAERADRTVVVKIPKGKA